MNPPSKGHGLSQPFKTQATMLANNLPPSSEQVLATIILCLILSWGAQFLYTNRSLRPYIFHAYARVKLIYCLFLDYSGFTSLFTMRAQSSQPHPPGLRNLTYACYQNSTVQALCALECVLPFYKSIRTHNAKCVANSLLDVHQHLNTLQVGRSSTLPDGLRKIMTTVQQQDASEFFSLLHSLIEDQFFTYVRACPAELGLPPSVEADVINQRAKEILKTFQNPFESKIGQSVSCSVCQYSEGVTVTQTPLINLQLTDGPQSFYDQLHLFDLIKDYIRPEAIEGVECGKCTALRLKEQYEWVSNGFMEGDALAARAKAEALRRLAIVTEALAKNDYDNLQKDLELTNSMVVRQTKIKQFPFWEPAKALVFHINRSIYDPVYDQELKNMTPLHYNLFMDLPSFSEHDSNQEQPIPEQETTEPSFYRYILRAVVEHRGNTHSDGHYVCYRSCATPAESPLGKDATTNRIPGWFFMSDEYVIPISEESERDVFKAQPFMLYYERLSDDEFWLEWARRRALPDDEPLEISIEDLTKDSPPTQKRKIPLEPDDAESDGSRATKIRCTTLSDSSENLSPTYESDEAGSWYHWRNAESSHSSSS
jgi:ubiquitin carboxyl-terminal hydrolase 1